MKKVYQVEDLCCAHCALELEEGIRKIDGIKSVSVNFLLQKMTVEADDESFDSIMKKVVKVCKKIEPDCTIVL